MLEYYVMFVTSMLFVHWFADFVCQTDEMAKEKSSSFGSLLKHIASYAIVFTIGAFLAVVCLDNIADSGWMFGGWAFNLFVITNVVSHLFIDYVTSRAAKLEFDRGNVGGAFVIIGFDQFLHVAIMTMSFYYIAMPVVVI